MWTVTVFADFLIPSQITEATSSSSVTKSIAYELILYSKHPHDWIPKVFFRISFFKCMQRHHLGQPDLEYHGATHCAKPSACLTGNKPAIPAWWAE
eukprot:c50676_g1_i1 orf=1-285(-)